jgi:hypothetical protein
MTQPPCQRAAEPIDAAIVDPDLGEGEGAFVIEELKRRDIPFVLYAQPRGPVGEKAIESVADPAITARRQRSGRPSFSTGFSYSRKRLQSDGPDAARCFGGKAARSF